MYFDLNDQNIEEKFKRERIRKSDWRNMIKLRFEQEFDILVFKNELFSVYSTFFFMKRRTILAGVCPREKGAPDIFKHSKNFQEFWKKMYFGLFGPELLLDIIFILIRFSGQIRQH